MSISTMHSNQSAEVPGIAEDRRLPSKCSYWTVQCRSLAWVGSVVIVGASFVARPAENSVRAEEFVLVDKDGKVAARLGFDPRYEEPVISFLFPHGSDAARLKVGLGILGAPYLSLKDSEACATQNQRGTEVRMSNEGMPGEPLIQLMKRAKEGDEKSEMALSVGYDMMPVMTLSTPAGTKAITVEEKK